MALSGCVALPFTGGGSAEQRRDARYDAPLTTAFVQWYVDGHRLLRGTQIVAPVTGVAGGYCNHLSVRVEGGPPLSNEEQSEVLDWLARVTWATDTHDDGTKPGCVDVSVSGGGFDLQRAMQGLDWAGEAIYSPGASAEYDEVTVREPASVFGAWPGRDRRVLETGVPDVLQGPEQPYASPSHPASPTPTPSS